MEEVPVTCPNCEREFFVAKNAKKGKCPFCKILLKYEDVEIREEGAEEFKEKVDIRFIENMVDAISKEQEMRKMPRIADVAVIETIQPEIIYGSIEKKVDRIIRRRKI